VAFCLSSRVFYGGQPRQARVPLSPLGGLAWFMPAEYTVRIAAHGRSTRCEDGIQISKMGVAVEPWRKIRPRDLDRRPDLTTRGSVNPPPFPGPK